MEQSDKLYARGLRSVGMASMLLGLSFIWKVINGEFLLYKPVAIFVLIALFTFLFFCLRMLNVGNQIWASRIIWVGIAYISIAASFRTLNWPGGMILEFYGVPNLIIVVATIIYLTQLPQEQRWSQRVLGLWSIGVPLVSCLLWYAMFIYQNYIDVDTFEPAIPYSDWCIDYIEHQRIRALVLTLGNGIALFVFSLPLYIVARKHSK